MILLKTGKGTWCVCVIFIFFLFPTHAWSKSAADIQTIQLFFENDLFGGTDKYYTNAVQITWLSKDLKRYREDTRLPKWSLPIIRSIPFSGDPESIHNVGVLMGHHIYTPYDTQTTELIENDRPYSGFLYGGLALHSKTNSILDTREIVFGVIGPAAQGEFVQNTVHETRNILTAKGWENQLHTEPAVRVSWQRKWRSHRRKLDFLGYDVIGHAGITLGNVRISGNAGGEIRFGINIPRDFGSDMIRAGAGVSAPVVDPSKSRRKPFGAHVFASSQVEAVAHDIFLDGNTWEDSHSVDKRPLVADLSIGFSASFDTVKLTYRHLFKTRQFDNQEKGQIIGSLTLTFSF